LIQGESGTGKELIARALYESSQLSDKPFVTINCAALPETLLESELFGHERGAFTGAIGSKQGLFEVADGGTLFIDEIGELALDLQAKLLRVLEDGSLRRVGSVKERRVKVRLIAATNRDLQQEVKEKRFREDLFYRVNVLTIHLPPLRQRPGDVRFLVEHFVNSEWQVAPDLVPTLERYSWPGNVRQLQNAIDRAKILSDDDQIRVENLPPEVLEHASSQPVLAGAGDVDLDTLTKHHILDTYERHAGNKARTARALGIGRRTLYRLLERYKPGEAGDP
jgi:transcriptional regulator with PAS, ATPase and Fis domain